MTTETVTDTAPVADTATPAVEADTTQPRVDVGDAATDTAPETFSIPEEYKEKGWAKKIKSQDDLYKQLDAQDVLIGKKTIGVPDWENATEEEIGEYFSKLRPEDKSAYKFPEGVTDTEKEFYSDLFHEHGIPAYVAEKMAAKHFESMTKQRDALFSAEGAEVALKESLGDNWKERYRETNAIIKKTLSEESQKFIDELPNATLAKFHKVMAEMNDRYGVKESDANANNSPAAPVANQAELRKQIRDQIAELDKRSHTAAEKQALISKLEKTYR